MPQNEYQYAKTITKNETSAELFLETYGLPNSYGPIEANHLESNTEEHLTHQRISITPLEIDVKQNIHCLFEIFTISCVRDFYQIPTKNINKSGCFLANCLKKKHHMKQQEDVQVVAP
ncbi:hypothetical protein CBL_00934 [Carabus blaptoides fortunei]